MWTGIRRNTTKRSRFALIGEADRLGPLRPRGDEDRLFAVEVEFDRLTAVDDPPHSGAGPKRLKISRVSDDQPVLAVQEWV